MRALRGPNVWSTQPALEAIVDLGPLRDTSSEMIPGFNDRLMSWLPTLIEHRCSEGVRGGFYQRLRRGTYLAHILEHTTLELQTLAGNEVGFGRARETPDEGIFKVAIRYQEEAVGRAALEVGLRLVLAAVYDHQFDIQAELAKLHKLVNEKCLGPSTAAIVNAATKRNIPSRRLNSGSLVQLGYGARQRRIWTAETDFTSAIAESIAQDKDLTKSMLRAAGVPVPEGRQVDSPEDAWAAAQDLGGAVVVKPIDANHGRGVFMDLTTQQQVEIAYAGALKEGSGVIVERFAPGIEHRLLVVGGKLVAASRGEPNTVTGDGRQTVAQLVDIQVNADPRRGNDAANPLDTILMTDTVVLVELEKQGYTPLSVPADGVRVIVRRNDNLSTDVTDLVHPTNAEHAETAAKVVGLDIAGIDVVTTDISKPIEEQHGVVVEVNAGPGLLMHLQPVVGQPRPVGEAICLTLFPEGASGRIPLVAVTGTNGKTTTARLVAQMLKEAGHRVGLTCSDGVFVEGRLIDNGDCAGPRSARNVLLNPTVDAAVFEVARGGILREGLGFDKCDVAIVTNMGECDHLGQYYVNTPEDMFKVKRTPVDVVLPTGNAILNANDPWVAKMAKLSPGGVIFFALDRTVPTLAEHVAAGGKAVYSKDGWVTLANGSSETPLVEIADLPATHGGRVLFQVENILAAAAAGWSLGLPTIAICTALQSFQGNLQDAPARFNVFELGGKTLCVTDGRNSSALGAVIETLGRFPNAHRAVVYSAEEDRRDADILRQAQQLGEAFDHVYLCEIETGIDRPVGEVVRLLRSGLDGAPRTSRVEAVLDWGEAVDQAWRSLGRGDLLLVQSASIPRTVRKLQTLLGIEPSESSRLTREAG